MTDDWDIISDKVAQILSEKFHEIRKDVSADEILDKVSNSFLKLSGVCMNISGVDVDMSIVSELFQQYNDSHRKKILKFANFIGEVVGDEYVPDECHILVKVQEIRIKIAKEMALEISILGFLPELDIIE
jgi:hypothetical protein